MDISDLQQKVIEVRTVFGNVLESTTARDHRAKTAKAKWWQRHRLHVLLEAAENTASQIIVNARDLAFTAELISTLHTAKKWQAHRYWPEIETALTNEYNHTVVPLHIVEHLRNQGFEPDLIVASHKPSPDLRFSPFGDSGHLVYIEIHQPALLYSLEKIIGQLQIDAITGKSLQKAKRQPGKGRVGIVLPARNMWIQSIRQYF